MKNNTKGEAVFLILVFMLNPLLGIIMASLSVYLNKSIDGVKSLMVLIMLYLCALNTTKVPESDMINYLAMYENVPSSGYWGTLSFLDYAGRIKDVAFGTLVYLLYYLTFGNHYLFIFAISFLEYWFIFMAIYKFGKEYRLPIYIVVSQVLILSFFTQYFTLTFHLIRQILSTSIFIYALTFRKTALKRFIVLSVIAVATHSAVAILVLLAILPLMQRRLKTQEIVWFVVFAGFSVALLSTFASFLLRSVDLGGSIEVAVSRVAEMEGAADSTSGFQLVGLIFSIMSIVFCLIERNKQTNMVYPLVINTGLVISFMILGLSASPLVQYRFFFFLYSYFPFLFPLFMREKVAISKALCYVVVVLLIVRFYMSFNNVFEYASVEEALLYPYPMLVKIM